MKIVHPRINNKIEISNHQINVLVIETPEFLCEILSDIRRQTYDFDGDTVLSIQDEPVSMRKHIELVIDPLSVDINNRALIKKIQESIETYAKDDVYFERTQKLMAAIEVYINELSLNFDASLECQDISFRQILKAAEIRVADEYDRLIDKIYAYMEVVREFEGDKLFVFVNLSSYIGEKQLQEFTDTVLRHSFRVLLIDSHDFERLEHENRLIIDRDLCEI